MATAVTMVTKSLQKKCERSEKKKIEKKIWGQMCVRA